MPRLPHTHRERTGHKVRGICAWSEENQQNEASSRRGNSRVKKADDIEPGPVVQDKLRDAGKHIQAQQHEVAPESVWSELHERGAVGTRFFLARHSVRLGLELSIMSCLRDSTGARSQCQQAERDDAHVRSHLHPEFSLQLSPSAEK